MKKLGFLLAAFILSVAFSSAYAKKKPAQLLKNEMDSVSYALGINIGSGIKQQLKELPGEQPNADLLIKGFAQAYNGDSTATLISDSEAGRILEKYFTAAQNKEAKAIKDAGDAFLAANKKRPGVTTTASGLQYEIITKGTGNSPSATDKVKVNYRGTLIDGVEFDSSYSRNEPAVFGVNQVISGWTEALQMMTVGSKWKIYLPSEIAYGERAAGDAIRPNSALIFEVELLDIIVE